MDYKIIIPLQDIEKFKENTIPLLTSNNLIDKVWIFTPQRKDFTALMRISKDWRCVFNARVRECKSYRDLCNYISKYKLFKTGERLINIQDNLKRVMKGDETIQDLNLFFLRTFINMEDDECSLGGMRPKVKSRKTISYSTGLNHIGESLFFYLHNPHIQLTTHLTDYERSILYYKRDWNVFRWNNYYTITAGEYILTDPVLKVDDMLVFENRYKRLIHTKRGNDLDYELKDLRNEYDLMNDLELQLYDCVMETSRNRSHVEKYNRRPHTMPVGRKWCPILRDNVKGIFHRKNGNGIEMYCKKIAEHNNFKYEYINLNKNFTCLPHYDKGNTDESMILGLGRYTGGKLVVSNKPVETYKKPLIFNGAKEQHYVEDFVGERYSIVWFSRADTLGKSDDPDTLGKSDDPDFENAETLGKTGNCV